MPAGYILKESGPRQWMMAEYWCDRCKWRGESLEPGAKPARSLPCGVCGRRAGRVISAAHQKTVWGWVQRGKNSKDDKPPNALDTEALASGMSFNEFHAKRRAERAERRRVRNRRLLS